MRSEDKNQATNIPSIIECGEHVLLQDQQAIDIKSARKRHIKFGRDSP